MFYNIMSGIGFVVRGRGENEESGTLAPDELELEVLAGRLSVVGD